MGDYQYREHQAPAGSPLVFMFHGTGGDENQFFDLAREQMPEAHLIAVRGDVSEKGSLRYFRRQAEGVYDMEDLVWRAGRLAQFVRQQVARVAPTGVGAFGYSNGANILATLLFEQPDLVDAAALMHPLIPWAPAPQPRLQGKPILLTAGEQDGICDAAETQRLMDYFKTQGSQIEVLWHPGGHEIADAERLALAPFFARALRP